MSKQADEIEKARRAYIAVAGTPAGSAAYRALVAAVERAKVQTR